MRTTHLSGVIADIGIEIGKGLYWNQRDTLSRAKVRADMGRLKALSGMCASFFGGGILGALGFTMIGFATTVPLAALLAVLSAVPIVDQLRR